MSPSSRRSENQTAGAGAGRYNLLLLRELIASF